MADNDPPPPPNQEQNVHPYPPLMYSYQYDPQWFAHQQAIMHQQMMHQINMVTRYSPGRCMAVGWILGLEACLRHCWGLCRTHQKRF
ncbi:hypothetical protein MHU86_21200 [Fragilaria crotonensis]|nr:hypothetical protein MHU86_21200 [Fragilaria crotonensis]